MNVVKWIGISLLAAFFLFALLLLSMKNWNWARDTVSQKISDMTGRNFAINGNLIVDWSLTPHIRIEEIQFENADWSKQRNMLELAALDIRIDLIELIKGRVLFPEIMLTKPHIILQKSSKGESNWEFQIDSSDPENKTEIPVIERLRIAQGRLVYQDPSTDTEIITTIATIREHTHEEELTELHAEGIFNGQSLTIYLNAGPLVALREAEIPYPLTLALQVGETNIKVKGTLMQPLQLKDLHLQFAMQGPDPEQLSQILGFPMPSLPPYRLGGNISHHKDIWQIKNLSGRVGDSDLAGTISISTGAEKLFIKADLTSKKIDLDDMGPLIGLTPDTGPGETASLAQQKKAKEEAIDPFVLPNDPIDFKKLQTINADLTFRSKHIKSKLPVDDLLVRVIIDNGHLILAPLDFGVATGNIRTRLELDTRTQPVKSKIETEIRHVQLGEILRQLEIADKSAGLIGGQSVFWFEGNAIAEMLASADGGLLMIMTGGQLDDLLVELAGLDIGEALVTLFDKDNDAQINCAYVDLPVAGGVMNMDNFVVDTQDTVFLSKGIIDLNKEKFDLIIDPQPKDLSIFSARAPLHIEGTFKKPTFTPGASAILRGVASLALLPSAPIVSLYAFLQEEQEEKKADNQENIRCSGLVNAINEARS
ncbi:AsmA family protein [Nitrosomonas supralitoralis]|uniref:AsmA family protein n=1 Tax=Nitrosomonas supralitoralis TaxID=2116706 RepID=A0A2P7NSG0_9PROT|nr:AsmA family protein [Nitrosomonas supralitoralis]PSJ16379.1 AsmA family protein [Nitrosomonas supralitoralis]